MNGKDSKKRTGRVIGKQLLRSGASVGANYRAACRRKNSALHKEADEILAILTASVKTAHRNLKK